MPSVIIATRDRPDLLGRALRSVAAQRGIDLELLLVDDSQTPDVRRRNAALLADIVPAGRVVETEPSTAGLGPGEARNRGIAEARRPLLAFLDDDDEWIDPDYLRRATDAIERLPADIVFADQVAIRQDGSAVAGPVWAEDLAAKLDRAGAPADRGAYRLTAEQVLLSDGFAHLNTTLVRRAFAWDRLRGFDAGIRYEEDRDFQLRAIDAADGIGYLPLVVARHHVPQARASASTLAAVDKDACRLLVLTKAAERSKRPAVRARARRDRAFALQRMAARAAAAGDIPTAARHAHAALRDRWSAKWAAYTAVLLLRSAVSRRVKAG